MRMVAYCRVSTNREEQLESLENQKQFFEGFASRNGHVLLQIYADEGISGKQSINRKAFLQLLEDGAAGAFELVVVKDISRFARNTLDFLQATRQLKAQNIEVLFLSNNQTVLGSSEFVLTLFSALAQEESANLSGRVKFGKKVNAKKGRVPNFIYGYHKQDTFTLVAHEQEAPVVTHIFESYVYTGLGCRKIALQLNEEGIPAKKGGSWTPKTIRRLLANPIYNGMLENNKTETIDFLTGATQKLPTEQHFFHPREEWRLVPQALFEAAQRQLVQRADSHKAQEPLGQRYALSALISCACCKHSFCRCKVTYKNTYIRWKCAGRNQYTANFCTNNCVVDQAELWNAFCIYLLQRVGDCAQFAQELQAMHQVEGLQWADSPKQLGKEAAGLERQKEKYKQMFAGDVISLEELICKSQQLEMQKAALQQRMEQAQMQNSPHAVCNLEELMKIENWNSIQLKQLVEKIVVDRREGIQIFMKKL